MKPLSKLHIEAVTKAKTEQDKIKAAANAMIETPMELIKQILLKHEQAVIEVMRELSQEIDQLKNRNWVGLTDEEKLEYIKWVDIDVIEDVEATLRDRNYGR